MDRSVPRAGAVAGIVAVILIVGYHLLLMALAGPRASGTLDAQVISSFYAHDAIAILGVSQFAAVVAFLVFAVALRESIGTTPAARFAATLALGAAIAEVPIVVTEIAIQAGLVAAVTASEPVAGLFRTWDVLYNSGLYALESTWVVAFGVALRGMSAAPRWMWGVSLVAGALLAINVLAIWIGIPDPATLPSALAISVWLVGASIGLGRMARSASVPIPAAQPA